MILIVWIIMGAFIATLANSKGRNPALWFFYGVMIWPIALIHISRLDPITHKENSLRSKGWKTVTINGETYRMKDQKRGRFF